MAFIADDMTVKTTRFAESENGIMKALPPFLVYADAGVSRTVNVANAHQQVKRRAHATVRELLAVQAVFIGMNLPECRQFTDVGVFKQRQVLYPDPATAGQQAQQDQTSKSLIKNFLSANEYPPCIFNLCLNTFSTNNSTVWNRSPWM